MSAGAAINRVYDDLKAIFAKSVELESVPEPRVTLGLTATDPEPLHVLVWPTVRDFEVLQALTGTTIKVGFHIWVTIVATGADSEEAQRVANAYLSMAVQLTLCDVSLGHAVDEVGIPDVKQADAWSDADGRSHAGYLLDFEVAEYVSARSDVAELIGE